MEKHFDTHDILTLPAVDHAHPLVCGRAIRERLMEAAALLLLSQLYVPLWQ